MRKRWVNYLLELDDDLRIQAIREDLCTFSSMTPGDQELVLVSFGSRKGRTSFASALTILVVLVGIVAGFALGWQSRPQIVLSQAPIREEVTLLEAVARDRDLYSLVYLPLDQRRDLVKLIKAYLEADAVLSAMRRGPYPCIREIWRDQIPEEISVPSIPDRLCIVALPSR